MRTVEITLRGRPAEYNLDGRGSIACLFIGPWQIYAQSFSEEFKSKFTIFSLDYLWVTNSRLSLDAKEVSSFSSLGDLLTVYQELAETLGLRNLVVIGPSALGLAAAEFARLAPERTAGVIMLASPLSIEDLPKAQEDFLQANYNPSLFPRLKTADSEAKWRSYLLNLEDYRAAESRGFSSDEEAYLAELKRDEIKYYLKPELAGSMYALWPVFSIPMRKQLFHTILGGFDFRVLNQLKLPIFAALGLYDAIIPPGLIADLKAEVKPEQLNYYIFNAAHMPQYEDPDEFLHQINAWLVGIGLGHSTSISHIKH